MVYLVSVGVLLVTSKAAIGVKHAVVLAGLRVGLWGVHGRGQVVSRGVEGLYVPPRLRLL